VRMDIWGEPASIHAREISRETYALRMANASWAERANMLSVNAVLALSGLHVTTVVLKALMDSPALAMESAGFLQTRVAVNAIPDGTVRTAATGSVLQQTLSSIR